MDLSTSITNKEDYKLYSVIGEDNWVVNACFATSLEDAQSTFPNKNYKYIEVTNETGPGYYPGYWDGNKIIRGDEVGTL